MPRRRWWATMLLIIHRRRHPNVNTNVGCSKGKYAPYELAVAPAHIRSNKKIVMAAVKKNGRSLQYAPPDLQNDREVVTTAVRKTGWALEFASPELQNDIEIVLIAIRKTGEALQYASQELQMDEEVWLLRFENCNGPKVVEFFEDAPPNIRNDKNIAMAAAQKNGEVLNYVSPELRKDKEVALGAVINNPDAIKFVGEDLKRDPDLLVAAGMFDSKHPVPAERIDSRKIALSTRFSLTPTSTSEATNFNALFKKSKFYTDGDFVVYAPNAFDKKTCAPNRTDCNHPCRGTNDTCQYPNVLTIEGRPTDDCCWRYSFRNQLVEAKDTNGFMLQLVETGKYQGKMKDATLDMGQRIELEMANTIGVKVFQVYRPEDDDGSEYPFGDRHIDFIIEGISQWYDDNDDFRDMSVTVIRQPYSNDDDDDESDSS